MKLSYSTLRVGAAVVYGVFTPCLETWTRPFFADDRLSVVARVFAGREIKAGSFSRSQTLLIEKGKRPTLRCGLLAWPFR
jgi:hypothetical protein